MCQFCNNAKPLIIHPLERGTLSSWQAQRKHRSSRLLLAGSHSHASAVQTGYAIYKRQAQTAPLSTSSIRSAIQLVKNFGYVCGGNSCTRVRDLNDNYSPILERPDF